MLSKTAPQDDKNSIDNVFKGIAVGQNELSHFRQFITSQDMSRHTVRALYFDIRKFAQFFVAVNNEPLDFTRVTVADITSFKKHLREVRQQSVATVNRALVSIRTYMTWLVDESKIKNNPAKAVTCQKLWQDHCYPDKL